MPEVDKDISPAPETPPLMGEVDTSLPPFYATSVNQDSDKFHKLLTAEEIHELAEQARHMLAYVLLTPEEKGEIEIWMHAIDYKALAALAREERDLKRQSIEGEYAVDENKLGVPESVLITLDDILNTIKDSRIRLESTLKPKDGESLLPWNAMVKEGKWLEGYKERMRLANPDLTDGQIDAKIVQDGKDEIKKALRKVWTKGGKLRGDEEVAADNMARTVIDEEVMQEFVPLTHKNPWVGINLLTNAAFTHPDDRPENFDPRKVDFSTVVENAIEASKADMTIAMVLAGILSNRNIDEAIPHVDFVAVIDNIIESPIENLNLVKALLMSDNFDIKEVYPKIAVRLKEMHNRGENVEECKKLLECLSEYTAEKMGSFVKGESVYKKIDKFGHDSFDILYWCHHINKRLNEVKGVNVKAKEITHALCLAKKALLTAPVTPGYRDGQEWDDETTNGGGIKGSRKRQDPKIVAHANRSKKAGTFKKKKKKKNGK